MRIDLTNHWFSLILLLTCFLAYTHERHSTLKRMPRSLWSLAWAPKDAILPPCPLSRICPEIPVAVLSSSTTSRGIAANKRSLCLKTFSNYTPMPITVLLISTQPSTISSIIEKSLVIMHIHPYISSICY